MKRSIIIFATLLISNMVLGQFSPQERAIIDGLTAEMCQCMEAEKMELTTYETFNAALLFCMNYDDSKFKTLIDSVYIQKEDFDFVVQLPDAISKSIRTDCALVAEFYTNNGIPDLANRILYEVDGLTLTVNNMDAMKEFYTNVFSVNFKAVENDTTLYQGKWGGFPLILSPANTKTNPTINRHQFDIKVNDLKKAKELVIANGGKVDEETKGEARKIMVVVYDPDGNGIVVRESMLLGN